MALVKMAGAENDQMAVVTLEQYRQLTAPRELHQKLMLNDKLPEKLGQVEAFLAAAEDAYKGKDERIPWREEACVFFNDRMLAAFPEPLETDARGEKCHFNLGQMWIDTIASRSAAFAELKRAKEAARSGNGKDPSAVAKAAAEIAKCSWKNVLAMYDKRYPGYLELLWAFIESERQYNATRRQLQADYNFLKATEPRNVQAAFNPVEHKKTDMLDMTSPNPLAAGL